MVQTRAESGSARARARQREILQAASAAFRDRGFHETSMRDIAARLGMTAGNLYYYFENKQALLGFCQEDTLRRLRLFAARVLELDLTAPGRVFLLCVGHVVVLNELVPGSLAHLVVEQLAAAERQRCIRARDRHERTLCALLQAGIEEGTLRDVDPRVAVLTVLGALNWTVRWYRPAGRETPRDLGARMADVLVRGLAADAAAPVAPADWQELLDGCLRAATDDPEDDRRGG